MSQPPAVPEPAPPGTAFVVLAGLFVGALVIAAVLAAKIIVVGPFVVPAGVLAYSITFVCTDVVTELHGRARARQVVLAGLAALLAALLLIRIALAWPAAPFWENGAAFESVLSSSSRIAVASIVAYLVSQFTDVYLFAWIGARTGGRHLWLRNNAATMLSQLLDSAIFVSIAFAGAFPLLPVILGQWAVKLGIALLDTPVVYLAVALLRRRA
jgi:queuosine precursor transporter